MAGSQRVMLDGCKTFVPLSHHTCDTVASKSIQPPDVFPLAPIVNKSYKIECCGNKMLQIVPNMMLYQYLQLKLNL